MAWYPIKQGAVAARLHRELLDAGVKRLLAAELCVHPDDSRAGLNGSGIVTINPPWHFEQDLRQLLPVLHAVLAERGAGRTRVAVLAGRLNAGLAAPVHGVEDPLRDAVDVRDALPDDRDAALRRGQHDALVALLVDANAAPRSCDAAASAR